MASSQNEVKMGWGLRGLDYDLSWAEVVVIVDVLSFSTSVDIAASRGGIIYPYRGPLAEAGIYAHDMAALLATGFSVNKYSLSPQSLLEIPAATRLVLPSPNGSTLSQATGEMTTLTGCFRNASAVGHSASSLGNKILVIAAGEKWPDKSLRPALEDHLGAGAIISAISGQKSPEAKAAEAAFRSLRISLKTVIKTSFSGFELISKKRETDLDLASELDSSRAVPILINGAYRATERNKPSH